MEEPCSQLLKHRGGTTEVPRIRIGRFLINKPTESEVSAKIGIRRISDFGLLCTGSDDKLS